MPRTKCLPWFRKEDGWWYGQIGKGPRRRQKRLVEGDANYRAAKRKHKELREDESVLAELTSGSLVKKVFIAFLKLHSRKHCSKETHAWYLYYLRLFSKKHGTMKVCQLKPIHVTEWLASKDWVDTTRNRAITCVKRAFNWASEQGIIKESPLKGLKKPPIANRERLLSPDERKLVIGAIRDKAFKLFLFAVGQTGARPGEVRKVTSEHWHPSGMWVFPATNHKTGKRTRKPRVIYLTAPMVNLCRRLLQERPPGTPLFLNMRGKPWTRNAVRCRFRQLRRKFPQLKGVVCYCFRHGYATSALERGIPIAQVSELLGHADTRMVSQFYGHLSSRAEHMREMAAKAIRPTGRAAG